MLESFDFQGLGKTAIESTRIPKPPKRGPLPGLGNPQAVGIRIYIYIYIEIDRYIYIYT